MNVNSPHFENNKKKLGYGRAAAMKPLSMDRSRKPAVKPPVGSTKKKIGKPVKLKKLPPNRPGEITPPEDADGNRSPALRRNRGNSMDSDMPPTAFNRRSDD